MIKGKHESKTITKHIAYECNVNLMEQNVKSIVE